MKQEKIFNNIKKILAIINKVNNISKNDLRLKLDEYKKLNILVDDLINIIWVLMYGKNRVNNEINNISADKEKDLNGYVNKYVNIVNGKISFVNDVSELIDELLRGIDENTSNDIAVKKLTNFKNYMLKSINNFNSYIKTDTKNNSKPDSENNNEKKDTKNNTKQILKRKILKITPNQILKMTSNGILMILGHL